MRSAASTTVPRAPAARAARAATISAPRTRRRQPGSATMTLTSSWIPADAGPLLASGSIALFAGSLTRLVALAATAGFAPLVAFRRGTLIIRIHDPPDQRMANHVARAQP